MKHADTEGAVPPVSRNHASAAVFSVCDVPRLRVRASHPIGLRVLRQCRHWLGGHRRRSGSRRVAVCRGQPHRSCVVAGRERQHRNAWSRYRDLPTLFTGSNRCFSARCRVPPLLRSLDSTPGRSSGARLEGLQGTVFFRCPTLAGSAGTRQHRRGNVRGCSERRSFGASHGSNVRFVEHRYQPRRRRHHVLDRLFDLHPSAPVHRRVPCPAVRARTGPRGKPKPASMGWHPRLSIVSDPPSYPERVGGRRTVELTIGQVAHQKCRNCTEFDVPLRSGRTTGGTAEDPTTNPLGALAHRGLGF